jgi:hypothetical protein
LSSAHPTMAKGRTRTIIGRTTQVATICSQTVRGPRVRQVTVQRSPHSPPKPKRAKTSGATPFQSDTAFAIPDEPFHDEQLNFISDLDPPSSKVACIFTYSSAFPLTYKMQSAQDYIEEWLPKKQMYLQALLSNEVPDSLTCHSCGDVLGYWRCRDCFFNPLLCNNCCRDNHASHPFHRIDHWTGSYYEPAWLFQVGVVLNLGHGGRPCPSYLDSSPPVIITHHTDSAAYADGGNRSTNFIVKELKRCTGVYDLGSATFSAPMDCQELTVVDVSGVHRMWVKWCNCPNAREQQENHLLQMRLFPVSYKNIRSTFTFNVLDDARMSNLECKSSAYQYYQKLRRLTSPMFPNAVQV